MKLLAHTIGHLWVRFRERAPFGQPRGSLGSFTRPLPHASKSRAQPRRNSSVRIHISPVQTRSTEGLGPGSGPSRLSSRITKGPKMGSPLFREKGIPLPMSSPTALGGSLPTGGELPGKNPKSGRGSSVISPLIPTQIPSLNAPLEWKGSSPQQAA